MTISTVTSAPSRRRHLGTPAGRRPTVFTAYRWEMAKLARQARARYTLLGCLIVPVVIVAILNSQQTPPKDTLYGRYIHASGYAMPLLILGFAAQWVFPLLTSLVAGDIFASEDTYGTWKTVLTRSVSRTQLFIGKTLTAVTFAIVVLTVLAASTIASSLLIVGTQPLTGLTGQAISAHTATGLVIGAWATALPPLLGFTALALLLSVLTRNSSVGVVTPVVIGLVMTLLSSLGALHLVRRGLLTTPFESWHGLFTEHRYYDLITTGVYVSLAWTVICLALAYVALRRRDITGG